MRAESLAICIVLLGLSGSPARAVTSFQGLGAHPTVGVSPRPTAIFADGSTVVGNANHAGSGTTTWRWQVSTGIQGLHSTTVVGPPSSFVPDRSTAWHVSDDGSVVGGSLDDISFHTAAVRNEMDGWTAKTFLANLDADTGGLSHDGSNVAYSYEHFGSSFTSSGRSFVERNGVESRIPTGSLADPLLGGPSTLAKDMTADGSPIAGNEYRYLNRQSAPLDSAWTWSGTGNVVPFIEDATSSATANSVSYGGSFVVGKRGLANGTAYRYSVGESILDLGALPGDSWSEAHGVSRGGSVVVGSSRSSSGRRAFIWDPVNGMRLLSDVLESEAGLDLTGWTLEVAVDISAGGEVVTGYGTNPTGVADAWVAVIPEPGTALLIGLGLSSFGARRWG